MKQRTESLRGKETRISVCGNHGKLNLATGGGKNDQEKKSNAGCSRKEAENDSELEKERSDRRNNYHPEKILIWGLASLVEKRGKNPEESLPK